MGLLLVFIAVIKISKAVHRTHSPLEVCKAPSYIILDFHHYCSWQYWFYTRVASFQVGCVDLP